MSDYIPRIILSDVLLSRISLDNNYRFSEHWYETFTALEATETALDPQGSEKLVYFIHAENLAQTFQLDDGSTVGLIKYLEVKKAYRVHIFCQNPTELRQSAEFRTVDFRLCEFHYESQLQDEFYQAGIKYFDCRVRSSKTAPNVFNIYHRDIDELRERTDNIYRRLREERLALQEAYGDETGVETSEIGD